MTDPAPEAEGGTIAPAPIEDELDAVEGALTRLDEGTYGRCRVCDAPLPDNALASDPTATACAVHAEAVRHPGETPPA